MLVTTSKMLDFTHDLFKTSIFDFDFRGDVYFRCFIDESCHAGFEIKLGASR